MTFSQLSCQTLLLEFFLSRPSFFFFSRRISHMKWPEWKLFVFLDDIFVKQKKNPLRSSSMMDQVRGYIFVEIREDTLRMLTLRSVAY